MTPPTPYPDTCSESVVLNLGHVVKKYRTARKVTSHAAVPTSDQLCDQPMLSSPDNALVQAQLPSLPASSSPPAAVCNVSLPPADKTPLINATFLTTAEQFWDRAYDALKTENPKLVDSYEKILSRYLDGDTGIQDDPDTRRKQMKQVIDVGLDRTSKEASLKERVGTAMDIISTAKATISLAIQNVPQASLPWAATCIALEMLANPIESARSSREGISRVIMMMDWYWSLTQPLLKRNETSHDAGHLPQMKEQLGAQIVELYKALLSYQITFVCYCYRHRGYAFLRDLINLDDWENKMEEVVDVETRVRQSFKAYTALQMTMRLEELVTSQKTDQDKQCLQDLWCTDPRVDKTRIEDTKGGLLVGSYAWILGSPQFQQWRDHSERRLLWIKGDPGKGKTMLLCGIIDELQRMSAGSDDTCLAWFFCQATDRRINSATSVLRGLIYMLTKQYPLLISHLREKYDDAGKDLFEGANACFALSKLLANMLQDPTVGTTYLVIDALDECTNDLPMLLDFFARSSSSMPHVKWLISSRNELHIEQKLRTLQDQARLSLELKQTAAHVTDAVNSYIEKKISHVYSDRPELQQKVRGILREKANGTFLWVSLVCQELDSADSLDPLSVVEDVPSGLYELYDRMMKKLPIKSRDTCRQFLSFTTLAFRPLHFAEAACLLRLPSSTGAPLQAIQRLVAMCGSFLTIQDDRVYLIHQSAKDYLSSCESGLFLSGEAAIHGEITLRSLEILKKVLHRDMYQLRKPGFSIDNVKTPSPDPLIAARYSAVYWTEHLLACGPGGSGLYLQDKGIVHTFFHEKFLYWLEALSLLRYAPKAVIALKAIQNLTSASTSPHLLEFLDDTYRFTLNHRIIDTYPLQLYSSALVFSPTCSIVRQLFSHEEPNWMVQKPEVEAGWDAY
ncbi:NACHT domain-containing protein, partial [Triangularia verruculosa]